MHAPSRGESRFWWPTINVLGSYTYRLVSSMALAINSKDYFLPCQLFMVGEVNQELFPILCANIHTNLKLFAGYPSLNITLVVDDTFGTRSLNHYPEGYGTIFHELLNFPRQILRYSMVSNQHSFSYSLTLNHIRTYSQTLSNSIQHPLNSPFCHRYKGCHGVTLYIHYNCSLNSLCVYLMFRYANGTT